MGWLRWPTKVLLALAVGGAAGLSGGLAGLSAPHPSPAAQYVDVYWLSGVISNGRACVGLLGLHGNNAYDLFADDSGPCYGPSSTEVALRTFGWSFTAHVTLKAYMVSEQDPYPGYCDYIEARTWQQPRNIYRGTYRYLHAVGSTDYWVDIWAGPNSPTTYRS
ncbi:MAG: hypothetical protein Q8O76_07725, partial [Chloroflexota bacterium]|nr:hypothetical protein [Chloroflexota bacterium]